MPVAEKRGYPSMIEPSPLRHLNFETCFNFRDLGGYPTRDGRSVRWRRLFRSDALNFMSPSDVAFARRELGIATVIDLRTSGEIQRNGVGLLLGEEVSYYHRPVIEELSESSEEKSAGKAGALADRYQKMLEEGASQIAALLHQLSSDLYPAVFHCAAGKDRTGIVAAIVLGLLGIDEETIVEDYMLSNLSVGRIVERMRVTPGYTEVVRDLPVEMFMVREETIRGFLERVRAVYGSSERFVEKHGVDVETVSRLRSLLLE